MTDTPASTLFTLALLIAGAWILGYLGAIAADACDAVLGRKDKPIYVARRNSK